MIIMYLDPWGNIIRPRVSGNPSHKESLFFVGFRASG